MARVMIITIDNIIVMNLSIGCNKHTYIVICIKLDRKFFYFWPATNLFDTTVRHGTQFSLNFLSSPLLVICRKLIQIVWQQIMNSISTKDIHNNMHRSIELRRIFN